MNIWEKKHKITKTIILRENNLNIWKKKKQFLKIKNSILEIEKHFMSFKDRELKDRGKIIEREIEELFYKPMILPNNDMDKFEEQEVKKIRPI